MDGWMEGRVGVQINGLGQIRGRFFIIRSLFLKKGSPPPTPSFRNVEPPFLTPLMQEEINTGKIVSGCFARACK